MKPGGSAALAIGAGYVLGRQHKLRTALMLGAAAATGRLLGGQGGGQGGGQQDCGGGKGDKGGGGRSGLVGKLGGAGKSAAITAITRSADRLGERLTERANAMRQGGSGSSSGEDDK